MARPSDPRADRNVLSYATPSTGHRFRRSGGAPSAVGWMAVGVAWALVCAYLSLFLGGVGEHAWPVLFAAPAAGVHWAYRRRPIILPFATALILIGLFSDSRLWATGFRYFLDSDATLPLWFIVSWLVLWFGWQVAMVSAFAVAAVASFRE